MKKIPKVIGTDIAKRQSDNFINEITEILKNEKEAREIFTNFCDENAHADFIKNHTEAKKILTKYIKENM